MIMQEPAAPPPSPYQLSAILDAIEYCDTNYDARYGLVLDAVALAHRIGMRAGFRIDPSEPEWPVAYIELPIVPEVSERRFQGTLAVSLMDADLLGQTWYDNGVGYYKRQDHLPAPRGYLHRLIAERMFGAIPEGYEVDHVSGHPYDCGRSNLRLATSHAQKLFQSRISVRQRKSGRWQAMFGIAGNSLGMADTREEAEATCRAHRARLIAACFANNEIITWPGSSNQISWHMPAYPGAWDGHDTTEKYARIHAYDASLR
jgi:hypothetical protein